VSVRGGRLHWQALVLCIAGLLAGLVPASASEGNGAASFDYLYIEANEGASSGGHAAIRFGSNVYHFQHREGLLVLERERVDEFLFSTALRSNRSVHISEIDVEPEVAERVADRFLRRHRAQEAQLVVRDALRQDRNLLESADASSLLVRGHAYFVPEAAPSIEGSSALRELRARVEARYGADYWGVRRRALHKALEALETEDPADWDVALPTSAYDHPVFARPWSSRLVDLAAGLAALDVLEQARALDPAALNAPQGDDFRLDAEERRALAHFARRLEEELTGLVGSLRNDWGQALLVGMARLAALETSLARGYFVFLDSFPDEAVEVAAESLRGRDVVAHMLGETREQLYAARRYFARAEDPGELAWERVEERLVRHAELERAARGERALRLARGHLVPARSAPYSLPVFGSGAAAASRADLTRVRVRHRDYARRIDELYRYGLISRNCVTAIFDTLNDEFQGSLDESRSALGGVVEGGGFLSFIPFVSAQQVNARYRVLARYTLSSYRHARLREMRERESPLWLALRESNTLSARTYQRGENDSFFIFFTEDPVWLRPLLGAVNLVAALGESVWGLVKLPVDGGQTLVSGLKGTAVSLPELVFANIRKGSNDWVAPEYRQFEAQPAVP
jgi:hypothetical protein